MSLTGVSAQLEHLSDIWQEVFSKTPPVGYFLRREFSERWTRFHALPAAKRYAETAAEKDVILHRANTLVTECFGEGDELWLITRFYPRIDDYNYDLANRFDMNIWFSWIDVTDDPEDQIQTVFYAKKLVWSPNSLDWLFLEFAKGNETGLFFSEERKSVLAPYDGGFDIVFEQPQERAIFEDGFKSWMSNRSDKL